MTLNGITPTRHGMTGRDIMQHYIRETWNDVKSDDMT